MKKVAKPEDDDEDVLTSMTLSRPDRVPKTELEFKEVEKNPAADVQPSDAVLSEAEEEKPEEILPSGDEEAKKSAKKKKKRQPKKRPETSEEVPVTAPETEETEQGPKKPEQPEVQQLEVNLLRLGFTHY